MDYIKGRDRNQIQIMQSLDEMVDKNNVTRIIDVFVENLDLKALKFSKSVIKETGRPPYNPKDMLKLYIYGMENGITSSRKLERECGRNIELMWLINEIKPESSTICEFRKENSKPLVNMFRTFCRMLKDWDLIDGKVMALDGTKIRANNSKKNNFSLNKLERSIAYIVEKIAKYMEEIDRNDIEEAKIPKLNTEKVIQKIQDLKSRKERYNTLINTIESGEVKEVSTTDPDSRLMSNNNGVEVSYNVQAMVDSKNKLVAGISVINNSADAGQLGIIPKDVKENLEISEMTVLADKGYYKTEDFKKCEEENITTIVSKPKETNNINVEFQKKDFKFNPQTNTFTCPNNCILFPTKADKDGFRRYKNNRACKQCPIIHKCTTGKRKELCRHINADGAERNNERHDQNLDLYKQRQMLIEHPFGTIKRTMGIRQFQTRGITNVTGEVALIFTTYNLKRLKNLLGIDKVIAKMMEN